MLQLWIGLAIFFIKALIIIAAILLIVAGVMALITKNKKAVGELIIDKVNEQLEKTKNQFNEICLDKKSYKTLLKKLKIEKKAQQSKRRKKVFVIKFEGDLQASETEVLRESISGILQIATKEDEVMVQIDSGGGVIHGYGLAASQLVRVRERAIPLTVCVDKIAASGGYLMACVANKIIAAPFAIIGSIGVIAQIPNFNKLLEKHHIDFEQITAGKYKRSLTMFGKNTEEGREKLKEDLEEIHVAFKNMISDYRPQVDIEAIATGEYWLASEAKKRLLVDELQTSDDYLLTASEKADVFSVRYVMKKTLLQKLQGAGAKFFANWV